MKELIVEVRNGLKAKFSAPATEGEYNSLAKRGSSACVDDAVDNTVYRAGLPEFWDLMANKLLERYSVPKLTKDHPKGTKDEKTGEVQQVVAESDPQYVDRVAGLQKVDPTAFQPIADEIGVIVLDPSAKKREGGQLIAKMDLDMAATVLAAPEQLATVLAKIKATTGLDVDLTGDDESKKKNLAQAIRTFRVALTKQALFGG